MNCSAYDVLLDYLGNCLPLTGYFPNHKHLKINNTYYRVVGNLGEGAFSTVYLCEDTDGNRVAVKKMLCYRGTDTLAMARREISAYRTFSGIPGIIRLVDWSVEDNIMEDRSEVFMCFPVLKNGTLADNMGERRSEMWVVRVFLKLCRSVDRMHKFEGPLLPLDDSDSNRETRRPGMTSHRYVPVASRGEEEVEGDDVLVDAGLGTSASGYVHRDIKPGNVMLSDDNETPILIDLGSVAASKYTAENRSDALRIQEDAAENCTMAYRAPELFDVQRNAVFDQRTDVWSLGCLLFAMAFGHSPFEDPMEGPGASIALAAINARYRVPEPNPYSDRMVRLIEFMLEPDPQKRPFVEQVIALLERLYEEE